MSNLSQLINHDDDDYSYNYGGAGYGAKEAAEAVAAKNNEYDNNKSENENENENGHEHTNNDGINGPSDGVAGVPQEKILASFERIKTHFPAARIKKIMQSDDEIGKVAQATPIIVGRALEIFMANLVEASIVEAKKQGVKRIGASHIRAAVESTEQFDFLVEAIEKYPSVKN